MERDQAFKASGLLTAAYPNWKPTPETIKLYVSVLTPLPSVAVEDAIVAIIRSNREFAPPVGLIVELATKRALSDANRPVLDGEEAWLRVERAIRDVGSYGHPSFGSPAISRAVEALGWRDLCLDPNLAASRAHFLRLYGRFAQREIEAAAEVLSSGRELAVRPRPEAIDHRAALPPPRAADRGPYTTEVFDIESGRAVLRDFIAKIGKPVGEAA